MTAVSNVHVHSRWCDGLNTITEMTEAAIRLGFSDIGFSSHSAVSFDPEFHGISCYEGYREEIYTLNERYAGQINLLCGIEQDMLSEIDRSLFDYIILSAHYFRPKDGRIDTIDSSPEQLEATFRERFGGNGIDMAEDNFSFIADEVKKRKPDIVGHYDVITKFNKNMRFFDETGKAYQDTALAYLDEIIDCTAGYGGMIEINTSGMRYKETGYPYAGTPFMLKRMLERKARVIITADSHETVYLNYKYDEAAELLRANGFKTMTVLKDRKFQDIPV